MPGKCQSPRKRNSFICHTSGSRDAAVYPCWGLEFPPDLSKSQSPVRCRGGQPEASALRWQREVHTSGPGSHVLKAQDGREGISSPILPLLRLRAARGHSFHGRHFALAWRAELRPWEAILRLHLWLYLRCGLQERCSVPNVWISKGVPFVQPHLCPLPTLISNVPPFLPFFVACYLTISCVEF